MDARLIPVKELVIVPFEGMPAPVLQTLAGPLILVKMRLRSRRSIGHERYHHGGRDVATQISFRRILACATP